MSRPEASFGEWLLRPEGTQAVHAAFDRLENVCPRYVSPLRSKLVGVIVTSWVVLLAMRQVRRDKRLYATSPDPMLRLRWLFVLALVV